MKYIFAIAIAILITGMATAQSKDRQVVASCGGFITTGVAQVSFTVGETAIQYLTASGASLSQGFQHADHSGTSISGINHLEAQVSIYPNPFIRFVEIKTDRLLELPAFQLADATGKIIRLSSSEIIAGKHWRIEAAEMATGNYWLTIISGGRQSTYPLTHIAN